jgi:nitrogen fixation/metabolism regulation signal transduction histidine kinase
VLLLVGMLVAFDAARVISRAEHRGARMALLLQPDVPDALLPRELEAAVGRWRAARDAQQAELDAARALLDTVNAALLVLDERGRVTYMNRVARALSGEAVDRLEQIPALAGAAGLLGAMHPGTREIAHLADGAPVYVACARYATPGAGAQRLISIQRIAGDLDAVEVKAWTDMARVLSHEIMNSLTPIASLSESLEQLLASTGGSAPEVAGAVEAIKRRSQGLINFVGRYRAVADLPEPARRQVALAGFLAGIGRLMSATFDENRVAYESSVEPANLELHADPELLEQALINLLRNAVEALDETPAPRIAVRMRAVADEVLIEVFDNGRGLSDDAASRVLTPFFTTKPGGAGIGLSVARHVALAHGGQLEVRRASPGGAVFAMRLPAARTPSGSATI